MAYQTTRPDNVSFLGVSKFLKEVGVNVPQILAEDVEKRFLWIEDLGTDDLWTHREKGWPDRKTLYEKTLTEVVKMHRLTEAPINLQPPFDDDVYTWEQGYFAERLLRDFGGIDKEVAESLHEDKEMKKLRDSLVELPRFLVHRDLQSENVMIKGGETYLIDYQGLRLGRPEYDLASLLYDPYVEVDESWRNDLLKFYYDTRQPKENFDEFMDIFYRCAAQRLMQSLGAYGYLDIIKEKKQYLQHIPVAKARLMDVLEKLGGFTKLLGLLRDLKDKATTTLRTR